MTILYKNKTAEKQFSSKHKNTWRYPKQVVEKLISAENFIVQAASLQDVAKYPPFHFHHLVGDRQGEWSIYLGNTGYRVTLIPCDESGGEIIKGDIMVQCKSIKVILVTEVSNHYE